VNNATIRKVLGLVIVITAVFVAVAFVAVRNINRAVAGSDWVNHTHAALLEIDGIFAALQAGDGALRTYVLTGNPGDRALCRDAFSRMTEHLEVAKALTRGEPQQHEQIVRLEALAASRSRFAGEVLTAMQEDRKDDARGLLAADEGQTVIHEVGRGVDKLKLEVMALLAERDKAAYLQAQTTRWTVWSGVVINFLLLAGVAWLIRDDIAARRRAATALEEANAQLEAKVLTRTTELAGANARLHVENLERRWTNQALEHQLRYNQLIVNSISDLVFVITKALNISRINPAVVHLTGREAAELVNLPLASVVQLATEVTASPPRLDPMAQALQEGRDLRDLPATIKDQQGRTVPVSLTLFPLRDQNKVVGGVAIIQINRPEAAAKT
jgi:PAS domain S-box-containing protein